jgi:hypothetical protein
MKELLQDTFDYWIGPVTILGMALWVVIVLKVEQTVRLPIPIYPVSVDRVWWRHALVLLLTTPEERRRWNAERCKPIPVFGLNFRGWDCQ